mgnify:CR=1 FL=1
MDEMKLKLSTRIMRTVAAKLIARSIKKKYGCKVDIHLNELDVSVIDGDAKVLVNAEVTMDNKEFMDIVKKIV